MRLRRHHDKPAHGEGLEPQPIRGSGIGQHADVGETCCNASGDFVTLALLQIDIDLLMHRDPGNEACREDVRDGGRVGA